MHTIFHEVRQALSQLRRSPGFTVFAIAILGLGLGATLYMFTFVKAYMLTPLPYPHAERIMHIESVDPLRSSDGAPVTQHDFEEWKRVQESFSVLAGFHEHPVILADDRQASRFDGAYVTPAAFDVTQVEAHIGRTLRPRDVKPGAPAVIVLGYDVWLNRYNGNPAILGESIDINGVPTTVVGVMPAGFEFPLNQDLWLPLQIDLTKLERGEGFGIQVFGRLEAGVTLDQARAEFASIAAALGERYEQNENVATAIKPFQHEFISMEARTVVTAMFVSVLFVLLIACANVANLMLARTVAAQKDIAVRTALGASRWRIVVQVLAGSIVLASAGAVIAYYLADLGLELTNRALVAANRERPFWVDLDIDWKVLAFGACAAIVAGVAAGLVPALRATRTDVNEHLKEGAKGSGTSASGLSRSLVTAEIALSCILLVCSGLTIRSVVNLNAQPLGIDTTNVLTGRVGLPLATYPDKVSVLRFFDELVERLAAHPEVMGATAAYSYPGIDGQIMSYRTRGMSAGARDCDRRPRPATRAWAAMGVLLLTACASAGTGARPDGQCRSAELLPDSIALDTRLDSAAAQRTITELWTARLPLVIGIVAYDSLGAFEEVRVLSNGLDPAERSRFAAALTPAVRPGPSARRFVNLVLGDEAGPRLRSARQFTGCAPRWLDQPGVQAGIQQRMRGIPVDVPRIATYTLFVRADGSVGQVIVRDSSGRPELDGIPIPELTRARFLPARREGIPVPVWVQFRMTFQPTGS